MQGDPAYGDVDTFAERIDWIIEEDYEDEGMSALLPLRAIKRELDAAAAVVEDPSPEHVARLSEALADLNKFAKMRNEVQRRETGGA